MMAAMPGMMMPGYGYDMMGMSAMAGMAGMGAPALFASMLAKLEGTISIHSSYWCWNGTVRGLGCVSNVTESFCIAWQVCRAWAWCLAWGCAGLRGAITVKRWKGASKDLMIIDHRHTIHTTPQSKPKKLESTQDGHASYGYAHDPWHGFATGQAG